MSNLEEPPVFSVEQKTIRIVERAWSDDFTWESMTTDLERLGYKFGQVVLDVKDRCLRHIIAYDEAKNEIWVTDEKESYLEMNTRTLVIGRFERYDLDAARYRLLHIAAAADGMDRTREEMQKLPRFTMRHKGLELSGAKFGWDDMTVHLAERGLGFGDVVVDKTSGLLHRVVAFMKGQLWITSAVSKNNITFDQSPDHFVKQA